jgi:hypothetical protein
MRPRRLIEGEVGVEVLDMAAGEADELVAFEVGFEVGFEVHASATALAVGEGGRLHADTVQVAGSMLRYDLRRSSRRSA